MSKSKINLYIIPNNSKQEARVDAALELLGLKGMQACFKKLAEKSIKDSSTFYEFLENLLKEECAWKEENRFTRWIQQARLPANKTLESFNFYFQPHINKRQIQELASCRFIDRAENVAFFGPPGVGKTHLAVALGVEAVRKGYETRFITLSQLIDWVDKTTEGIARHRLFQNLMRPKLLILDEIDLYETNEVVGIFLSKLLQQRYEKGSVIFTSNQNFTEWKKIFGNEARAGAIIDRMMHHAELIYITGESYRLLGKDKTSSSIVTATDGIMNA